MTERKITIDDIMSNEPCYPKTKVERLFGDLEYVTMEQILACDIPITDRIWVGVYLLTDLDHVVEFAKKCAERAQKYADAAADADARYASAYAAYADHAAAATRSSYYAAYDASNAAAYAYDAAVAAVAAAYAGSDKERDLQIAHLKELHARETAQAKAKA